VSHIFRALKLILKQTIINNIKPTKHAIVVESATPTIPYFGTKTTNAIPSIITANINVIAGIFGLCIAWNILAKTVIKTKKPIPMASMESALAPFKYELGKTKV